MPMQSQVSVVRLGTDCSGMETPAMALKNLGVCVEHSFSCDINKHAKTTIMANFPPKVFYEDLTARDNKTAPAVDLYVAGFPCQPFSTAGKQQGFGDAMGRGTIFFRVRDYIAEQEPSVFVLENVSGLMKINGGQYFKAILQSLEALGNYNIYHQILDTKQHGVPQSRRRVYMVGIKKTCDKGNFQFPQPLEPASIEKFLEPRKFKPTMADLPSASNKTAHANVKNALEQLQAAGHNPFNEPWIIDCDSSPNRMKYTLGVTPCFTCSRAAGHWVTNRGRRMTKIEMLRLQGMPTPDEGFKVAVSDNQLGRQIGNAMSCNVLERLFVQLLPAAGLARSERLEDRWASAGKAPVTPPAHSRRLARRLSKTPSPCVKRVRVSRASTEPNAKRARVAK
jgi:DNA (cytosine-5)-methyltransferase 1